MSRKRNTTIEEFIDLYKSKYCLWRVKCKEYHEANKRAAAYEKLVTKLRELEPNATKEDVIKKNNNLRSNVRKEKKKIEDSAKSGASADEVYKPTLWYYDLFDFLKDQDTPRVSRCNMIEDDDDFLISAATSNEDIDGENSHTENDMNSTNVPTNESTVNEHQLPPKNSQTRSRPSKRIKEGKLTNEVLASVHEHFKRPAPQEDRYDLLGKSISIKLRSLEKRQRLIAEKILNDTLYEAELGHLNYDSYLNINKPSSTPSPTYIVSSPTPSPESRPSIRPPQIQQAQAIQSQSYQDNNQLYLGSSQNLFQNNAHTSLALSIPEETIHDSSLSSYYNNCNFD